MIKYAVIYLLIVNAYGFAICGIDKSKAQKHEWRIPEKRFFITAFLGGAIGVLLGMQAFRHKTRHKTFTVGIPLILIFEIAIPAIICIIVFK